MTQYLSILVGLGGVVVAGLSVWLGYRSRRANLRAALYTSQLHACLKVTRQLRALFQACLAHVCAQPEMRLTREARNELSEPHRLSWRLQLLRGWSHEQHIKEVSS